MLRTILDDEEPDIPSPRTDPARGPRTASPVLRRIAAVLGVSLALAAVPAACSRRSLVFPKAPVVLISIDTLRADHLPVYGYRGVETPNLDALAADSIVFENAVSQVPLTLPSHVSLLTGLLPFENGVRDNVGYRLDAGKETLAARLAASGYATGAAVSAVVLDHATGVSRGFAFYEDSIESSRLGQSIGQVQRPGGETARRLQDWMSGQPKDRPVFAWLHLYEPHTPYEPPEPFRTRYAASPYDGEIASADEIVGHFVAFLKERGIYDRAVVVLLSDHGEGLGQHGEEEHGILLYRETVRVPLFVKLPKRTLAGTRAAAPAQLADVAPTVLAAVGLPVPPAMHGVSLSELAIRKGPVRRLYSETLYPRYHFGWSDLASLTDDRHQYIESPEPELYDWTEDPGELRNLVSSAPPALRALRAALLQMSRPLQPPGVADPETVKKLAALGYIGVAAPAPAGAGLPDPKARIGSLAKLKEANGLAAAHQEADAVALLRQFADENPRMLDVWESLARILRGAGRPKEAREALARADQLAPGTPQILMGLADVSLEARDFARARSYALAAQELGASGVEEELAAIALAEGDLAEAARHAEAAIRANPQARVPLLLSARVDAQRGNWAAALATLDRALEIGRQSNAAPLENLRAARGDALARLGRDRDAEADFRAEIRDFPNNFDAWSHLAILLASAGRGPEFGALLLDMTRTVPTARAYEVAARLCDIVGDRRAAEEFRRHSPRPLAPDDPLFGRRP